MSATNPSIVPLVARLARAPEPGPAPFLGALAASVGERAVRPLFATGDEARATPRPALSASEPPPRPEAGASGAPVPDEAERERERARELEREALAARDEAEEARRRYAEAVAALAARAANRPTEPRVPVEEIVDLALLVARELVQREVRVDRAALRAAIDDALAAVAPEEEARARAIVRVSPHDLDCWGDAPPAGVAADPALGAGEFVIETPEAQIDGRLGPRLEAMRAALVTALASTPSVAGGAP
jgi:flagellar assembly protein FliH